MVDKKCFLISGSLKILIFLLTLINFNLFAEPNYVYHEASTSTIGTGSLKFRDLLTPNRTQSLKVGFKIEFQWYWNQSRIYYTTDGSNPSGSYGIGNGTTQVLTASFDHNFGSPVVDAVTATIPAQPSGTVVKYIVSAWDSGGGDEIFGNGCGNAPRQFCSTEQRPSSNATIFSYVVSSTPQKSFPSNNTFPVSLNNANGSCTTPGLSTPNVFNVPVSGVGTMTSINRLLLASIQLSDCNSGSKNLNEVQIRLISPSGQCYGIYSGGLSTIATGRHYINLISSTTCLNNPNLPNSNSSGSSYFVSGNNGYFNAQFSGVGTDYSNYTGSADGNWRVVFSETTVNPPCVESIRLTFGDPNIISQGSTGTTCSNPIIWDGSSTICGNTTGMSGSSQMPGSLLGPNTNSFGTIGGTTCGWNFANNNDVWVKHVATNSYTCLSLSGISGTNVALQTIVVTDADVDKDGNPCTQVPKTSTNDPNWIVSSCPRNSIYSTTAGTQRNQQHCFTSEIGKTYYLVIDGDDGAFSKFWMWGFSYNNVTPLDTTQLITFVRSNEINKVILEGGIIKIKTENNIKKLVTFLIYDTSGKLLYEQKKWVKGSGEFNLVNNLTNGINLVKVLIDDKKQTTNIFKVVKLQ